MSTSATSSMQPQEGRKLNAASLAWTLFTTQIQQLLTSRKTIVLALIQLLPLVIALFYLLFEEYVDGLTMFRTIIERATFPFLIPMTALFYGGPTIVDEIEGRTLTYLTLRPIPKSLLYFSKLLASLVMAQLLVVVPMVALFFTMTITGNDPAATIAYIAHLSLAAMLATAAYTTLFGALGVVFAKSLVSGIVYFVTFEMVLASIPVFEVANIRYFAKIFAEFNTNDRASWFNSLIQSIVPSIPPWIGAAVMIAISILCLLIGSVVFSKREYRV